VLAAATGFDARSVGYLVSAGGVVGALGMLAAGRWSDRRGDRFVPALVCTLIPAGAFVVIGLAPSPAAVVTAYMAFAAACFTMLMLDVTIWTDVLHVRLLAVGSAAINTMSQVGAFIAPYLWGAAKDATGSYRLGLMVLPAVYVATAALLLILRAGSGRASPERRNRARRAPDASADPAPDQTGDQGRQQPPRPGGRG